MSGLPGFGDLVPCWKCQGTGQQRPLGPGEKPKAENKRARKRAKKQQEAGNDVPEEAVTAACAVCSGAGGFARRERSQKPGRVTPGRSSEGIGPRPAGVGEPGVGEELCCLCGGWRIFQRVGGHRYSTEDVVTAWVAASVIPADRKISHVDIGCGIGSVLQMVAWRCASREYAGVGVEAQPDSAALARRSVAYNGARCEVLSADLREFAAPEAGGAFRLVTGTPPYYSVNQDNGASTGNGALPRCEESAGARFEFRGGIEAYCDAGARCLRANPEESVFVCCEGGLQVNLERVALAAKAAGLRIERHLPVLGREGRPPLFGVWVFRLGSGDPPTPDAPLVVRDLKGDRTPEYLRLLDDMAMTP